MEMVKTYSLSVNRPCSEPWDTMQPAENGRFCAVCQKNVVDFSVMNDAQIIAFFENYQGGRLCKKIKKSQQNRVFVVRQKHKIVQRQRFFWKAAAVGLGIFLLSTQATQAQNAPQDTTISSKRDSTSPKRNFPTVAYLKAEISYKKDGIVQLLPHTQVDIIHKGQIYKSLKTDKSAKIELALPREVWEDGFSLYWQNLEVQGQENIAIHQRNKWLKVIFSGDIQDEGVLWGDFSD